MSTYIIFLISIPSLYWIISVIEKLPFFSIIHLLCIKVLCTHHISATILIMKLIKVGKITTASSLICNKTKQLSEEALQIAEKR